MMKTIFHKILATTALCLAGATAATWAVMFLAGVFFAIMSQS